MLLDIVTNLFSSLKAAVCFYNLSSQNYFKKKNWIMQTTNFIIVLSSNLKSIIFIH